MSLLNRFIARLSWPHTLAGTATLVAIVSLAIHGVVAHESWTEESGRFARHASSSAPATCQRIAETCEAEATNLSPQPRRAQPSWIAENTSEHEAEYDRMFASIACKQRLRKEYKVDCTAFDPGDFEGYFFVTAKDPKLASYAVAAWASLLGFIALTKLFYSEQNLGWRRIALVAAISSGVAAVGAAVVLGHNEQETLILGAGGFLLVLFGVLAYRRTYAWVREGFRTNSP